MAIPKAYQGDLEVVLSHRHDLGADFWTTADLRWGKGSPFSTFDCILILKELGMANSDPMLKGAAQQILETWREDGRFRPAPKSTIFPCHTANAARVLARVGLKNDRRLKKTFDYLLDHQHVDGGWRCNTVKLGTSAVTDASNPGVTLAALDALQFVPDLRTDQRLRKALKFLLDHFDSKRPLGPCAFGIGSLFSQIEFPFLRYNIFFYVYVLSHYPAATKDKRFLAALKQLKAKTKQGQIIVENPNRRLAKLEFCKKGAISAAATKRFREIESNVASA